MPCGPRHSWLGKLLLQSGLTRALFAIHRFKVYERTRSPGKWSAKNQVLNRHSTENSRMSNDLVFLEYKQKSFVRIGNEKFRVAGVGSQHVAQAFTSKK